MNEEDENKCGKVGELKDLNEEESGSSSEFLASEVSLCDENSSTEQSSSPSLKEPHLDKRKLVKQGSCVSGYVLFSTTFYCLLLLLQHILNCVCVCVESEMMKERFAKLLLGEDMSGCGNGVCTALAISNAITNLCGMNVCLNLSMKILFLMVCLCVLSYTFWSNLETRASAVGEETHVAEGNGVDSVC